MKKLLLLAIGLVFLTSCQFKEEITFNKNGSGEYKLSIDMGGFMSMAKEMGQQTDSLKKGKKEVKDTVYRLSELFKKDSEQWQRLTDKEKELLKALKDVSVVLHMDENNDQMEMAYVYPFKKTKDLNNILEKLKQVEKLRNNNVEDDAMKNMPKTEVSYVFKKHKFQRKVKLTKPVDKPSKKNEDLFNMMQYKLVYHFPYPIKSVSYKDAMLSADRKTLIIEAPLSQVSENPEILDFEVKFD